MGMFLPTIMFFALAGLEGDAEIKAGPTHTELSWDSPRIRELEKEYESLWDTYGKHREKVLGSDGKTKYRHVTWLVSDLFRTRLSRRDLCHLAFSCGSLPSSNKDRSEFANSLLAFMVRDFVNRGDRSALIRLLSVRCPSRVG
jgi:hypothetical protein